MESLVERAVDLDITSAVAVVASVAINETCRQADELLGGRPTPGTAEWEAMADVPGGAQFELASQLLRLRLELAVGLDPLGSVIGLRRWGATWELVARAAGTSRQAAYERWGRRVKEVLDRYQTGEMGGPVADDESDLDDMA